MPDFNEKADAYYAARQAYDQAKSLSDQAHAHWRRAERELVDFMLENGLKKVSRDDGTTPMLVRGVSISVTKGKFDAIREWLRDEVGDDKDFVEETVSKPRVLDHVKTLIEEKQWDESDFPECLSVNTRPTLRVDGWSKRA